MSPLLSASLALAQDPATAPAPTVAAEPAPAAPAEPAPVEAPGDGAAAEEPYPWEDLGTCTPGQPHFDLEVMYAEQRYDEGLKEAKARIATAGDKDLYWHAARFMFEIGERFQRTDKTIDKEAWYQQMLDTVESGLAKAPGDPHLRFARGIAMGRLGTTRGVLSSLFMAKDVETDWLSVAQDATFKYASINGGEQLPCDAYHALGIYYRLVPDWWIVQVLAGTRGDLHKSLDWHQRAVDCRPDCIQNWKELGATQLCIGYNDEDAAMTQAGLSSMQKVLAITPDDHRDRIDLKHARMLMADPSLACEYSRDGQQDLDQDKLEQE